MESAISSKKIIFKFFTLLFAINVSFGILPGGIIPSYGLFGEVASFAAEENQESDIQPNTNKRNLNKRNPNKSKQNKGNLKKRVTSLTNKKKQKAQYAWVLLIIILFIHYFKFRLIYSDEVTPVGLKVRMND
ncbi:MAG: hypothetical protein KIC94_14465 [Clostridiales bacterium]|nr:hypothetical protein [Clostridiales bacterium]